MYKLRFCSQKEWRKCIFQQSGDLSFKMFSFAVHLGDTSWRQWTKQTVKKLNLWGETAVDKSAWIKACSDKYLWGISYEYLSWWLEPTKEETVRLCLCHTIFIEFQSFIYVMLYAIWYHLYNLKNVKNTRGGVMILVNNIL